MTDLEAFRAMLTRANIPFKEFREPDDRFTSAEHVLRLQKDYDQRDKTGLWGYGEFYADFYFHDDGSLAGAGIWE